MSPLRRLRTRWRKAFSSSLRLRVLVLTLAAFAAVALPAFGAYLWIVDGTTQRLSTLFAERQVLYDRHRGLGPLSREVALAETLARSPTIRVWATDEEHAAKKARGLAALEHFRESFGDGSYFFVLAGSGNYYFDDGTGAANPSLPRYTLSPRNGDDAWFYKTLALGPGCRLNVNNDRALAVTKVWINCVVESGGRPVGVLGTGIDLTAFIGHVVNTGQPGVETVFVDGTGAVQATSDRGGIDLASLTKEATERKTVFQMIDDTAGRSELAAMMAGLRAGHADVATSVLSVGGRDLLVGVGYLPEIEWYNVTLMDVEAIVGRGLFVPIGLLLALVIVAAAALTTLLFKRSVLDRIAHAEGALRRIEDGDYVGVETGSAQDEIGRLTTALDRMAQAVRDNTNRLEHTVRERTEQLERIAFLDPMTGIANRRGFSVTYDAERTAALSAGEEVGLLLLDVDLFKSINDTRGHQAGDEVIAEVARRLASVVEDREHCARWGGDEFVVLVRGSAEALAQTGRRVLDALRGAAVKLSDGSGIRITTSIGAHVAAHDDTLSTSTAKADVALYEAKRAGRNRIVLYDHERHGTRDGVKVA